MPSDEVILNFITTILIPRLHSYHPAVIISDRITNLLEVYQIINQWIIDKSFIPAKEFELDILQEVIPEYNLTQVRRFPYLYMRYQTYFDEYPD